MEVITQEAIQLIREKINEIISQNNDLDEREEKIIRLRYGIDKEAPINIKELSKIFKVPPRKMKEEVDNIERKVFNMLKRTI